MKVLLVYNPFAGHGRAQKILPEVEACFLERGIEFELRSFPKIFTGEHVHIDEIETFKAREIIVETGVPKVLTPDGELLGITPIEEKCLHRAVEVFWR